LVIALSGLNPVAQGATESVPLVVNDARPVKEAVHVLFETYPVKITYEDPRYEYTGDLKDISVLVTKNSGSSAKTFAPVGGALQTTYEISSDKRQPVDVLQALNSILDANKANGTGGRFAVLQSGDVYHVVPTEVRNSKGVWVKQQSLLDTRITFSSGGEMRGDELMHGILKQLGAATDRWIGMNEGIALNTLFRYKGTVDVTDEPARDVLMSVLHSISPRLTWIINFDPTPAPKSSPAGQGYLFNVLFGAEGTQTGVALPDRTPKPGDQRPGGGVVRSRRATGPILLGLRQ
jgi:hypothetical protein